MTATPSALHSQNARGERSQCWGTDPDTYARINAEFRFDLDAAAESWSARCPRWFGPGSPVPDSLAVPWTGRVWLNPPYGRGTILRWVDKVLTEAPHCEVIYMFVAFRPETEWMRRCFESPHLHEERRGTSRETFLDPDTRSYCLDKHGNIQSAGFPQVGLVFRPTPRALNFPVPRLGLAFP